MKTAPLSLDASYPTLIHIVSELEGSSDAGYDVQCDVQVAQSKEQERRWRIELGVKFSAKGVKRPAYQGEIKYVGIFTVADEYPTENIPRLVAVTAPSILYSSIRELVALLTGRSPLRPFVLLPTVSFIDGVIKPLPESEAQAKAMRVAEGAGAAGGVGRRKTASYTREKRKLHASR
jgi:preprotein translocase subunit SecB